MSIQIQGFLHSYETLGALDGPGLRFVAFLQGCGLRCGYCHNPDTWSADYNKLGKPFTPRELMEIILQYRRFYEQGGVTLSGGEPLLQPVFCAEVIKLCHENGLHTAIDTAGAVSLVEVKPVVDLADLIILDIKALDVNDCKELTGRDNSGALEMLDYCEKTAKPVWIRHVIVPGITLVASKLEKLADYLSAFTCVKKVELLPFHKMGEYKWEESGKKSPFADIPAPTEKEIASAKQIFLNKNLPI